MMSAEKAIANLLFRLLAQSRAELPATIVFASRDPAAGEGEDGYGRRIASVDAILASARYPRIEFTFTETELETATAEMKMLVEMGALAREVPVAPLFVAE